MEFSIRDELRHSVEFASHGKNTVIYDDLGNPNVMYLLQKYDLGYLNLELDKRYGANKYKFGSGVHPAFIMDGKEVGEIYISKYENTLGEGGVPISVPADHLGYNYKISTLHNDIRKKGKHWRMFSNAEWCALMQLSWANNTLPNGHNGKPMGRVLTFTQLDKTKEPEEYYTIKTPASLTCLDSHDGTKDGVIGLIGNAYCWISGYRTDNAKIRIPGRDNIPTNDYVTPDSDKNWLHIGTYLTNKGNYRTPPAKPEEQKIGGIAKYSKDSINEVTIANGAAVSLFPVADDRVFDIRRDEATLTPYAVRAGHGICGRTAVGGGYFYIASGLAHFTDEWCAEYPWSHGIRSTYIPSWEYKD